MRQSVIAPRSDYLCSALTVACSFGASFGIPSCRHRTHILSLWSLQCHWFQHRDARRLARRPSVSIGQSRRQSGHETRNLAHRLDLDRQCRIISPPALSNVDGRVDAPIFDLGHGQLWRFRTCAAVYEQKRECNASSLENRRSSASGGLQEAKGCPLRVCDSFPCRRPAACAELSCCHSFPP